MSSSQESTTIRVYCKIPYTDISTVFQIQNSLTTKEFLEYVNINVRNNLNINQRYDIEIVDTGKPHGELAEPMEPRCDETLLERYGNTNTLVTFYARPINPITREFIRNANYRD